MLISALSFELMDQAYKQGGFDSTAIGFVGGAIVYTAANWYLATQEAKHRKRSGNHQPLKDADSGSGLAIAVGALLDGIPESIVIGVSLINGKTVSAVAGDKLQQFSAYLNHVIFISRTRSKGSTRNHSRCNYSHHQCNRR